jgi:hypothetical protein
MSIFFRCPDAKAVDYQPAGILQTPRITAMQTLVQGAPQLLDY